MNLLAKILTKKRLEMFMLTVQGYSRQEVSEKLSVSKPDVSKLLKKACKKLEARNLIEAINVCLSHGLLTTKDMKRRQEHE
ncbi:MAG: hypothetical protein IJQ77_08070 [Synergistaceae bacterium]|nr:hypothetical protein [Synergistaceae bacterium]